MGVGEERTLEKYCPRKYEKSNPSQLSEINSSVMKEIFIRKKIYHLIIGFILKYITHINHNFI